METLKDKSTSVLIAIPPYKYPLEQKQIISFSCKETLYQQPTLILNYNNNFQVISVEVNGDMVNYQYDADNLQVKAGDLSLTRNTQNGLLTATQLGHLTTERTHNIFGETSSETARYETDTLYHTEYSRDKLGRITQRVETIEGITTTIDYRYDTTGRLTKWCGHRSL